MLLDLAGRVELLLPRAPHHEDGPGDPGHDMPRNPGRLRHPVSQHVALGEVPRDEPREIRFRMHGELELDLALVLWVDLEDLALGPVVRLTQHKGELWGTAPPPCSKS